MTKITYVRIKNFFYRAFEIDGVLRVVMIPIGKVGDCIRL